MDYSCSSLNGFYLVTVNNPPQPIRFRLKPVVLTVAATIHRNKNNVEVVEAGTD
jgi:hypothetical protein